jgi:hypothetical protein
MSRTIRRKNVTHVFNRYYCYDYILTNDNKVEKVYFKKDTKEFKKSWHRYFGDRKLFSGGVPSKFVNIVRERPFRQKAKQEVQKYLKNTDYELLTPKFIHDAAWHYF